MTHLMIQITTLIAATTPDSLSASPPADSINPQTIAFFIGGAIALAIFGPWRKRGKKRKQV